ncbi:Smr/MutS family protein, partial [bacterium]|nr:Smr/MutS family protein [bacterium]
PQKIDVRGMYPEEAWEKVDKILDDAVASGAEKILIVHGKGKGTLRRYIRDKLHADPRVVRMMLPSEREGGDGATIAVLADANLDNNKGGNENERGTQEN